MSHQCELSLLVEGPGLNPHHRSHWAFLIHRSGTTCGDLLQTLVLDPDRLCYQFEERAGIPLESSQSEGHFRLAVLTEMQRMEAKRIIAAEPAPRDGRKRCQDWVVDVLVELEVEELVEAGLAEKVGGLVGMSARQVAAEVGSAWVPKAR